MLHELHRRRRRVRRPGACRPSASNTAIPSSPSIGTSGTQIIEPIAQIIARPERDPIGQRPERGCAEPRLRRHDALRVGQVLRLRPRRGRRARQCRRANTPSPARTASTPTRCSASPTSSRAATRSRRRRPRQCRPRFRARHRRAPTIVGALPDLAEREFLVRRPRARFDQNDFALHRFETRRHDELQPVPAAQRRR